MEATLPSTAIIPWMLSTNRNWRQRIQACGSRSSSQIHQIYLTDFPFIVLFSQTDFAMVRKGTHNYQPGPFTEETSTSGSGGAIMGSVSGVWQSTLSNYLNLIRRFLIEKVIF